MVLHLHRFNNLLPPKTWFAVPHTDTAEETYSLDGGWLPVVSEALAYRGMYKAIEREDTIAWTEDGSRCL